MSSRRIVGSPAMPGRPCCWRLVSFRVAAVPAERRRRRRRRGHGPASAVDSADARPPAPGESRTRDRRASATCPKRENELSGNGPSNRRSIFLSSPRLQESARRQERRRGHARRRCRRSAERLADADGRVAGVLPPDRAVRRRDRRARGRPPRSTRRIRAAPARRPLLGKGVQGRSADAGREAALHPFRHRGDGQGAGSSIPTTSTRSSTRTSCCGWRPTSKPNPAASGAAHCGGRRAARARDGAARRRVPWMPATRRSVRPAHAARHRRHRPRPRRRLPRRAAQVDGMRRSASAATSSRR